MELPVFNSILHGELRPWLIDFSDTKRYVDLLRQSAQIQPNNGSVLQEQLVLLLSDFPTTLSEIKAEPLSSNAAITPRLYDVSLLPPYNIST